MPEPPTFKLDDSGSENLTPNRFLAGWVSLALLLALFISGALMGSFQPEDPGQHAVTRKDALLNRIVMQWGKATYDESGKKEIRDAVTELSAIKKSPSAARTVLVLQREIGDAPDPQAVKTLTESKEKADREFAQIYARSKWDAKAASVRAEEWAERGGSVYKLARLQALKAAGKSAVAEEITQSNNQRLILFSLVVLLAFAAGCVIWIVFSVMGGWTTVRQGRWPLEGLSLLDADKLAMRVALLLGSYLLIGLVPERLAILRLPILCFLMTALVFLPIFGHRLSIDKFFTYRGPKIRAFAWALSGELALAPVMVVFLLVAVALMNYLPPPTHPLNDELAGAKSATVILGLYFQAAIFAPIVEEIIFRGMLCPAIARLTNPFWGITVSSLAFAMIHPQGLLGWPALAAIGAGAAIISRATRSLVPSMILHGIHNAALVTLSLWVLG